MQYFSSDWHIGHKNILEFDKRPFATIAEHDQTLLDNYNAQVTDNDEFFYLGDFCMGGYKHAEDILSQMKGQKYFILGNHDEKPMQRLYRKYGMLLGDLGEIEIEKQKIILCHYSMRVWRGNHRGNWHLYGHSHGSLEHLPNGKSFDMAVNIWDYKPVSFTQVKAKMDTREIVALDHHNRFTAHR